MEVLLNCKTPQLYLHFIQGQEARLLRLDWFQALDIGITGINTLTLSKLDMILARDDMVNGQWDRHIH